MAIPKPEPRDWQIANAQELKVTDREVLALLRASKKRVDVMLRDLGTGNNIRRAQLEKSRSVLLAEQATLFTRLGDVVSARRASAASRAARLSAASQAALLSLVGESSQAQALYDGALEVSQRAIDAALARMRLSALPLSSRIYNTSVWMGGRLGKLINETLATGLNAKEFAKRARDWFDPNTPGGVRYAAMRLARTEINNAFHAISAEKYATTPWIEKVNWNLSKSHPKPDICNAVAAESPYPSDKVPARPHPQCMCFITGEPIAEDDFVENFLAGEYDDYLDEELEKVGYVEPTPEPAAPATSVGVVNPDRAADRPVAQPELTGRAAHDIVPKGLWKRGSLTPKQRAAVKVYETGWFAVLNGFLRGGSKIQDDIDKKSAKTIEDIDSAMDGSVLPAPIQTWRGMLNSRVIFGDRFDHDLTGFSWNELGFGSTTTDWWNTRSFLAGEGAAMIGTEPRAEFVGQDTRMKVHVMAGVKALEISTDEKGSVSNGPQDEIALQRNTIWKVVKDSGFSDKGTREIEVEVYPGNVSNS